MAFAGRTQEKLFRAIFSSLNFDQGNRYGGPIGIDSLKLDLELAGRGAVVKNGERNVCG
jgi:hypothetical protein